MNDTQPLKRKEVRSVFRRHRGELAKVAESLGANRVTVSRVLSGHTTSQRIMSALVARANELRSGEAAAL